MFLDGFSQTNVTVFFISSFITVPVVALLMHSLLQRCTWVGCTYRLGWVVFSFFDGSDISKVQY